MKIFIYLFLTLPNLIMIRATLPENGHEIMHAEGTLNAAQNVMINAPSIPTSNINGINDLDGIEAERKAIINAREAFGNQLVQIDDEIAKLQNDPLQLENVHKLFEQRIQIGQHFSILHDNIKRLNQREKEIRKSIEMRVGKRQKNLQEAENTQIENIDSASDSDRNEILKLSSSDEEYAKNLEQEMNDVSTDEPGPKRKQSYHFKYQDDNFPKFVNSDPQNFKNIVQRYTCKDSNTTVKPKRKFKASVAIKTKNNNKGKIQLQHEQSPQPKLSEQEINELNAIEVEKDVAVAERELLGKNLSLVQHQIAKVQDDPTQQEHLPSLLLRRNKIISNITNVADKIKALMRKQKDIREMIKYVPVQTEQMQMQTNGHENNNFNLVQQLAEKTGEEIVKIPPAGHIQMQTDENQMPENNENALNLNSPTNHSNVQIREEIHHIRIEQNGHANLPADHSHNNNLQQVRSREEGGLHLFKEGIKRLGRTANKNGGKLKNGLTSRIWENLLLAMIGEQFLVCEEVVGAVCSVRKSQPRIHRSVVQDAAYCALLAIVSEFAVTTSPLCQFARVVILLCNFGIWLFLALFVVAYRNNKIALHGNLKLLYLNIVIFYALGTFGYFLAEFRYLYFNLMNPSDKCLMMTPSWYILLSRLLIFYQTDGITFTHLAVMIERIRATKLARSYENEGHFFGIVSTIVINIFNFLVLFIVASTVLSDWDWDLFKMHPVNSAVTKSSSQLVIYLHFLLLILIGLTAIGDYILFQWNKQRRMNATATRNRNEYNLSENYQLHENINAIRLILPLDIAYMASITIYLILVIVVRWFQTVLEASTFLALYNLISCSLILYAVFSLAFYRRFLLTYRIQRTTSTVAPEQNHSNEYFRQLRTQWA